MLTNQNFQKIPQKYCFILIKKCIYTIFKLYTYIKPSSEFNLVVYPGDIVLECHPEHYIIYIYTWINSIDNIINIYNQIINAATTTTTSYYIHYSLL